MFNYFTLITLLVSKLASRNWNLPKMFYFKIFYPLANLHIASDLIKVFYSFEQFPSLYKPMCSCTNTQRTAAQRSSSACGCVGVHPLLNYVTRQNLSHASTFSQSSSNSSSKASTKMSSAAHQRKYCAPMHSFEGRNSTAPAPSNLSARKELSTYTVFFLCIGCCL